MSDQSHAVKLKRSTRLVVVFLSIIFALLVGEVALRIVGYSYPEFYTTDAARGYALRPCTQGWYRKEGAAYVSINCAGLRDREHTKQKPPGTLRIALIGDSYAEALQVHVEDAFWAVAERRLQDCPALGGRKVEFINFGVSGYGTAQELITLEREVWGYQPDIVLLALTTNNDITDNSRPLKRTNEIPYFVLRDGQLVLDDSFRTTRAFRMSNTLLGRTGLWLRAHLRVIQAIIQAHHALKLRLAAYRARRAEAPPQQAALLSLPSPAPPASAVPDAELGTDNLVYRPPAGQVWQDAWRVTELLIARMRDEVRAHGAQFYVVTLSNGIQVYPDAGARTAFLQRVGATDIFYPDMRIRALCERERIPVFTLAPQLQAYADEHKVFLHGFGHDLGNGHWNRDGHRVAGELVAQQLCQWLAQ